MALFRLTALEASHLSFKPTLDASNIIADRAAGEARLAVLRAGGDFADRVIAHLGLSLGAETFASFDQKAVVS